MLYTPQTQPYPHPPDFEMGPSSVRYTLICTNDLHSVNPGRRQELEVLAIETNRKAQPKHNYF